MIELAIFFSLLTLGFLVGRLGEAAHYKRLRHGEQLLSDILIFSDRNIPQDIDWDFSRLVLGSAVMSNDYFSAVLAGLRKLFGGQLRLYEHLVDRARREAVLRMKEAAKGQGANVILNVKFTTTNIGAGGRVTAVEVLAFGTAMRPAGTTA